MEIIDLKQENQGFMEQAAKIIYDSFRIHWPDAWPTLEAAHEEVLECLGEDRILRVAVESNQVIGLVGGIEQYDGNVWELHPLAVRAERRGEGIGRLLVDDLEKQVASRGGLTIWLGTDDENDMTSLSKVDLYDNLWEHIQNIKNYKNHPYGFYQKLGFKIVGVMPDANGIGKPDIYMAKRVK